MTFEELLSTRHSLTRIAAILQIHLILFFCSCIQKKIGLAQLHLGVNSGATKFAIENQAINEATFRSPDELGWKPQVKLRLFY